MAAGAIDITVEPYGVLDDQLGGPAITVALQPPCTVQALLSELAAQFPGAAPTLARTAAAREDTLLTRETVLEPGQSIALLPPVSGGQEDDRASALQLTDAPLDPAALMAETASETAGAVVVFGGTVRVENHDKRVTAIDYSAYKPLAESALTDIETEIAAESDVIACRVQHRLGRLVPGEASVYVVVRAGHRNAAFTAGRQAIDAVKSRVPIWKNEHFADGSREYVAGTPLATG